MKIEKVVDFKFDTGRWSSVIGDWINAIGEEMIAEIIEADDYTIVRWSRGRFAKEFPYPSMTLFLRCCNALDLDPREFFVLEDE